MRRFVGQTETEGFAGSKDAYQSGSAGKRNYFAWTNGRRGIANVDKFLDDAVLSGLSEVRVVHGSGTGALRKGLHKYFATHPAIDSFRLGKYGEGESGVTIVTLK